MFLQNSNISLCINGTFTYMQITHAVGTTPSQRLVFALFLGSSLDGLFNLWNVESDIRFSEKQAEI